MPKYLKTQAPAEFVAELQRLEDQSDRCYEQLKILSYPKNIAAWAILTRCVRILEDAIEKCGAHSPEFRAAMINTSRYARLLLDWIQIHGLRKLVPQSRFKWTSVLEGATNEALNVAHNYESFLLLFPAWHKDYHFADIVAPQEIRFIALGDATERRVGAFQKGFRPRSTMQSQVVSSSSIPDPPELKARMNQFVLDLRRKGPLGFVYVDPLDLIRFLARSYVQRLATLFRRDDSLQLRGYSLRQFKLFFAALLSISAVHEHACFRWKEKDGTYPLDSAVLVRTRPSWIDLLAAVSSLSADTVEAILFDLTLPPTRPLDLLVHPFVPLDANSRLLGLVPHFPLHSNSEENIIRVCSVSSPEAFSRVALSKEREMREDLVSMCPQGIVPKGPLSLPQPLPDLDLLLEDKRSSTLLITELKWSRKPLDLFERIDRDAEVRKGVEQLRDIRHFLEQHPHYVVERGVLAVPLYEFKRIHYVVIARDHFICVEPRAEFPVFEYDCFKEILARTSDLELTIAELMTFEWLPVEGRDFTVREEARMANGVCVRAEFFYPM